MLDKKSRPRDDCPPDRWRMAAAVGRLRREVRRWRRRTVGLGAALAGCLAVVLVLAPTSGEPEAVPLGTGVAGVEDGAGKARPEPPPPAPAIARFLGEGRASFYSDVLEGRPTASGEPYRGADLTAAHRSLPFGSRLRVTNLANGRSVVLRVNDRGPFARNRVLDVSRTAADRLGMRTRGHTRVRLELLE